ncbi:MAG: hypothetical protein IT446_14665 [Phycisphaerales bacterium]|jgi:hypothetical protein|nr:hypothetical protein [Phycisphaerales bacterium]
MNSKWFKYAASAVVAGGMAVGGLSSTAQAGSLVLGDSGWKASWSSAFDNASGTFVTLTVLAEDANSVVLQKVAGFRDGPDQYGLITPIEINFEQIRSDAKPNIVFTSEQVSNDTGTAWSGFKFIIEDGQTGTPADTQFDVDATFNGGDPFDTSPFKFISATGISSSPQVITLGDGTLADGDTWLPGIGAGAGELVILGAPATDGSKRFVFKEQPIPGNVIPLPAAMWSALSGLIGLGVFGSAKGLRRKMA